MKIIMKNSKIKPVIIVFSMVIMAFISLSWGVFGHEHINNAAVMVLPKPLQTFFYNHIDFIIQESTVPDLRKYTLKDKEERPRHFIISKILVHLILCRMYLMRLQKDMTTSF